MSGPCVGAVVSRFVFLRHKSPTLSTEGTTLAGRYLFNLTGGFVKYQDLCYRLHCGLGVPRNRHRSIVSSESGPGAPSQSRSSSLVKQSPQTLHVRTWYRGQLERCGCLPVLQNTSMSFRDSTFALFSAFTKLMLTMPGLGGLTWGQTGKTFKIDRSYNGCIETVFTFHNMIWREGETPAVLRRGRGPKPLLGRLLDLSFDPYP